MTDLKVWQERAYQNKVRHGFNTTDLNKEILLTITELSELFKAANFKDGKAGEELADVLIYILGLAQILDVDLEQEVERKLALNERRVYKVKGDLHVRVKSRM